MGGNDEWLKQIKAIVATKITSLKMKNEDIYQAIRDLSKKSEISYTILHKWYLSETTEAKFPICTVCNKRTVYLKWDMVNPYSKKSKYYGLCQTCKRYRQKDIRNGKY